MSDLERIVARTVAAYVEEPNGPGHGYIIDSDDFDSLAAKAHRWDALTSEETIEKGLDAWLKHIGWEETPDYTLDHMREILGVVLRAVAGVEE